MEGRVEHLPDAHASAKSIVDKKTLKERGSASRVPDDDNGFYDIGFSQRREEYMIQKHTNGYDCMQ